MSTAAPLDTQQETRGSGGPAAGTRPPWLVILVVAWVALAAFGAVGIVQRVIQGERLTAYSSYIPWGLWVAAYIFFVGLSAGAFLLSSLAYVFEQRQFERIGPLALFVAVISLLMGLVSIFFDLGHPERFWEVFVRPQFRSMMAWIIWLYTAYFVLLLAQLGLALRRQRAGLGAELARRTDRWLRILGTIGIPLVVAESGGAGALFGTIVARDYWNTAILPIMFLNGSLLSGSALVTAVVVFLWRTRDGSWRALVDALSRIVVALVLLELLLVFAELTIPAWYQVGSESKLIGFVLFGPYWYVFWVVYGLLGVVLPLILFTRRSPQLRGVGAGLVAVTFFAIRLDLVIPGLVTPELRGLESAYLDPIGNRLVYTYLPSLFEWQVTAGVVALGIALFVVGYRFLRIEPPDLAIPEEEAR